MKWLYIISGLLLLTSCRTIRSVEDTTVSHDTLYISRYVHDSVSMVKYQVDTFLLRDEIIIYQDTTGKELKRVEYHYKDQKHYSVSDKDKTTQKNDSAKSVSSIVQKRTEIKTQEYTFFDRLKLKTWWCLLVTSIALTILLSVIIKRK